jgi:hypothetical protein
MNILMKLTLLIGATFLLGGCLYPQAEKSKYQGSYPTQIEMVQRAVDQFQADEDGILPINTKDAKTPIYQKYVINLAKISPRYMAEPPEGAYESGGFFQYVLVNVEKDPTVKLLDIRLAEAIQNLALRLNAYQQKNGYPPFKERLATDAFTLDYEKLGLKEAPTVTSPFSHKQLYLILDGKGKIYVDYTPDLYDALQTYEEVVKPGEDIREILVKTSDFVPAYSLAYTIDKENKPIFLEK